MGTMFIDTSLFRKSTLIYKEFSPIKPHLHKILASKNIIFLLMSHPLLSNKPLLHQQEEGEGGEPGAQEEGE